MKKAQRSRRCELFNVDWLVHMGVDELPNSAKLVAGQTSPCGAALQSLGEHHRRAQSLASLKDRLKPFQPQLVRQCRGFIQQSGDYQRHDFPFATGE